MKNYDVCEAVLGAIEDNISEEMQAVSAAAVAEAVSAEYGVTITPEEVHRIWIDRFDEWFQDGGHQQATTAFDEWLIECGILS